MSISATEGNRTPRQTGGEFWLRNVVRNRLLDSNTDAAAKYNLYATLLESSAQDGKRFPELGLSVREVGLLAGHVKRQKSEVLSRQGRSGHGRIGRLEKSSLILPSGFDPFRRIVAGDLRELPRFKDTTQVQLDAAVRVLLGRLPAWEATPKELMPEEVAVEDLLSENLLNEAFYYVAYSPEESVASTLEDPVELLNWGVVMNLRTKGEDDSFIRGTKLPTALIKILESLKHAESEKIFSNWILQQCSRTTEEFETTVRLLRIFIHFTSIPLDTPAHLQLWKPRANLPEREREFIVQAFETIANSVGWVREQLVKAKAETKYTNQFEELERSVKFRFAEVLKPSQRTSEYTARERSLTPTPTDLAEFAHSVFDPSLKKADQRMAASAIVRLAESIGVSELGTLVSRFHLHPGLQQHIVQEAVECGLFEDPTAAKTLYEHLKIQPWYDAAERDWARVIKPNTKHLRVEIFTGTFGPFTRGHKDLVQIRCRRLKSYPTLDVEGEDVQHILLIVPMMDPIGIPDYPKIPSRVGGLNERVSSIFLGLGGPQIDRDLVFVTTLLQPKPHIPQTLEQRSHETIERLRSKILWDFDKVGRVVDVDISYSFTFGGDAIKWTKPEGVTLDKRENQPGRVKRAGSSALGRRGFQCALLKNLEALKTETGIEELIITPGITFTSSTAAIKELEETGYSNYIDPGAHWYFAKHWNKDAQQLRRDATPPTHYPTGHQIYLDLMREMEENLKPNL